MNAGAECDFADALEDLLARVESSGEQAVVLWPAMVRKVEAAVNMITSRGMHVVGCPPNGLTILPMLPLPEPELRLTCGNYCLCSGDAQRADFRRALFLRPYPLVPHSGVHVSRCYHPADLVMRMCELCLRAKDLNDEEMGLLEFAHPFACVSPMTEIIEEIRSRHNDSAELVSTVETPVETVINDSIFSSDAVDAENDESDPLLSDLTGTEAVDNSGGQEPAHYFSESDFPLVSSLTESKHYDTRGGDHRLAAVYIPNAIPLDICHSAASVLGQAASRKNLRAKLNGGTPPDTGIVGFYDYLNNPTQHKCRETEFSRKNGNAVAESCAELLRKLDYLYQVKAPPHHRQQYLAIPQKFRLLDTVFSTITVNRNFRTAAHRDSGDFRGGFGVLCVIDGDFSGCHLAVKELGKAFPMRVGDVLLFDTSLEHGNTEVHNHDSMWSRTSVVCYLRNGLMSSICQMELRKRLNRLFIEHSRGLQMRRDPVININVGSPEVPPIFVPLQLARELTAVQLSALGFASERIQKGSGCVIALTMGLGKTLLALSLAFSVRHSRGSEHILILAPKPLIGHWIEEHKKWNEYGLKLGDIVASVDASCFTKCAAIGSSHDRTGFVFVINPENMKTFLSHFPKFSPALIVVDEGHRVASAGNKLVELLKQVQCTARVVLSGTPMQNDANELYRLVKWVNDGFDTVCPRSLFIEMSGRINRYIQGDDINFDSVVNAQKTIMNDMKGFVFRQMENGLPPLHDYILVCGSSATQDLVQQELNTKSTLTATDHDAHHLSTHPLCYFAFWSRAYQSLSGGKRNRFEDHQQTPVGVISEGNASTDADQYDAEPETQRLEEQHFNSIDSDHGSSRSLSQGHLNTVRHCHQLVEEGQIDKFVAFGGKLCVLVNIMRLVSKKGEKAIIFSQYVGVQDLIHRTLTACEITAHTVRGRDSLEKRDETINQFRASSCSALILSTKISAYGLDFTVANHVILFDSWWNPQVEAQAIARAYRRGQEKPVTVYRLASAVTDKSVLGAQFRKIALFESIMRDRTTRAARTSEIMDCVDLELDSERRQLWVKLKDTPLEGSSPALLFVYLYSDCVKEARYSNP